LIQKIYIITGISSGIGKALVEALLQRGETIIGIGRNNPFPENSRYTFYACDLSDLEQVRALHAPIHAEEVVLINNAGMLGTVDRISQNNEIEYEKILNLNTIAPLILTQKFYQGTPKKDNFTLVNISSGAAKSAIPSWSGYCASKSALNMWTDCFVQEEEELGNHPKVYCIAPGVIDTPMQQQIRSVDPESFSSLKRFQELKSNNKLFTPQETAEKLIRLLSLEYSGKTHYDLRDL